MKISEKKQAFIYRRLAPALILSSTLVITLLAALYHIGLNLSDLSTQTTSAVFFAILSLVAWVSATFLGYSLKCRFVNCFSAVLWWLCFAAYGIFFLIDPSTSSGSAALLVLALPAWSYIPVVELIDPATVAAKAFFSLAPSLIIASVNTALAIILTKVNKNGKQN